LFRQNFSSFSAAKQGKETLLQGAQAMEAVEFSSGAESRPSVEQPHYQGVHPLFRAV
jgi:hypothetical protein